MSIGVISRSQREERVYDAGGVYVSVFEGIQRVVTELPKYRGEVRKDRGVHRGTDGD